MTLKTVTPRNLAEYTAAQWLDTKDSADDITDLLGRVGGAVVGPSPLEPTTLTVLLKRRGRANIKKGSWIVALGSYGAVRIVSDRVYKHDYKEIA